MSDMRINQNRGTQGSQDINRTGKQERFVKVSASVDNYIQSTFPEVRHDQVLETRDYLSKRTQERDFQPETASQVSATTTGFVADRLRGG